MEYLLLDCPCFDSCCPFSWKPMDDEAFLLLCPFFFFIDDFRILGIASMSSSIFLLLSTNFARSENKLMDRGLVNCMTGMTSVSGLVCFSKKPALIFGCTVWIQVGYRTHRTLGDAQAATLGWGTVIDWIIVMLFEIVGSHRHIKWLQLLVNWGVFIVVYTAIGSLLLIWILLTLASPQ